MKTFKNITLIDFKITECRKLDCPLLFFKHRSLILPIKYNYSFKSFIDKSAVINENANIAISDADTLPMK